jgi:membrane protein
MPKASAKDYFLLFKEAFKTFADNHPVKFASAIAYFSLFALPCMFLIILYTFGLFFDRDEIIRKMQEQLGKVLGEDGAEILIVITEKYKEQAAESLLMTLLYAVIIFWLSTQLFRLFQNSLNDLWQIKPNFKSIWKKQWVERGIPFLIILATGLVFVVSLLFERGLLADFQGGGTESSLVSLLGNLFTALLVFLWFALLYKMLPMVHIQWGPTFLGAAVTTLLFYIGAWLLWNFVVVRDLEDIYVEVASIIRVGLWVFYSSLVFLYGASFTKAYASLRGKSIAPSSSAYKFVQVPAEKVVEE